MHETFYILPLFGVCLPSTATPPIYSKIQESCYRLMSNMAHANDRCRRHLGAYVSHLLPKAIVALRNKPPILTHGIVTVLVVLKGGGLAIRGFGLVLEER